jgi:hypothetical protein
VNWVEVESLFALIELLPDLPQVAGFPKKGHLR